ncbi:FAD dependent oxidoreductase TIGR03364 [Lentzea albidocapillata subsp. violacea]|uniref:FAD dependent oxidoreductase TIGR03364 n=1 Tax=Lentzea albidocapillata subsp. violacea TaxID=128104 RepID=A0A1G9Y436_9PSEU|nr:FAD-dependent oxidoreductase [Lentzea albidocapillata]SDN03839.1 FAD dependent oxidoreductase TIGR03364 [Lentzea albidocapillata subsp. violacea]
MTSVDLVVVGAGIVGLAHAWHAVQRGLSVAVVERDEHAAGASVRNFGHGCFTAQDGVAFSYAMTAREQWLKLAREAGFWLRESGSVVVARAEDELEVLREFAEVRDVELLNNPTKGSFNNPRVGSFNNPHVGSFNNSGVGSFNNPGVGPFNNSGVGSFNDPRAGLFNNSSVGSFNDPQVGLFNNPTTGLLNNPSILGAAFLPLDIRVDPREAVHAIAGLLNDRGVTFHWSTNVLTIEPGLIRTSRGEIRCRAAVVAVGHDIDRFFPEIAEKREVQRCQLRMLRVAHDGVIDPAVLTGFSMLRYDAFARCPSIERVRERLTNDHPELVEAGLNLMFTQLPDGSLTIGDTHHYSRTVGPYRSEDLDDLVLTETARLLGVPSLRVLERWRGIYASAPEPFLTATPAPLTRAVSVTSGIGMTTALGLAPAVLDDLLQEM